MLLISVPYSTQEVGGVLQHTQDCCLNRFAWKVSATLINSIDRADGISYLAYPQNFGLVSQASSQAGNQRPSVLQMHVFTATRMVDVRPVLRY